MIIKIDLPQKFQSCQKGRSLSLSVTKSDFTNTHLLKNYYIHIQYAQLLQLHMYSIVYIKLALHV